MTQFNMIDSPQGPDTKRLLLAVVVSSAILMAYSYFFQAPPAVLTESQPAQTQAPGEPVKEGEPKIAAHAGVFAEATGSDIPEMKKDFFVKESVVDMPARASYRAQISNRGALLSEFALTDFSQEKSLFSQKDTGSSMMRLSSTSNRISLDENALYEVISEDDSSIVLRHITKEGLSIERHYNFTSNGKLSEKITWKNLSAEPLKNEFMLSAVKTGETGQEPGLMNPGVQGEALVIKTNDKHERLSYTDLIAKPKTINHCSYLGFEDQFFISAILPSDMSSVDKIDAKVIELELNKREARFDIHLKSFVLMAGEEKTLLYEMFMGPKQVKLLASVVPPLDENIDFGWFGILSRPMLWLLVQIFGFVHNYGIAIILITLIIKLLTYPLTAKSFSSQQSMKVLQPKIKELQQKFGHDRTLLGQKQMELYRSHGVNPVAGCLPMLFQLPIWFAFFQMLRSSVELFDQPFYWWIHDLTRPDQYYVLPVLMGGSMLIQQFFTPPPSDQPQMKYVMWSMPIFLTFIMLNMPSGLSLYILTNNLLTILQQIIIKRQSSKVSA